MPCLGIATAPFLLASWEASTEFLMTWDWRFDHDKIEGALLDWSTGRSTDYCRRLLFLHIDPCIK